MIIKGNRKVKLSNKGFTLLEVIIAIAIFAVISLASFSIFDTILRSDQASQQQTERLNELQRAFLLIERDILQIARRSVRFNGEKAEENSFIHTGNNDFIDSDNSLAFVRHGWSNPVLLLPRSDMQLVAYQLKEETLERLHFNFVDAVLGEEPKVRPLITGVKELMFEFYDGKKWQKTASKESLPLAIAIELELEDYGIIRRQFLVAGGESKDSSGSTTP